MIQLDNTMNDVERAEQLTSLLETHAAEGLPNSIHVNAVADAMINVIDGTSNDENAEGESAENSDEEMETASERRQLYLNSELCECPDLEEWMVYHHGASSDDSPD